MKNTCLILFSSLLAFKLLAQLSPTHTKAKYPDVQDPCGGIDSLMIRKGSWGKITDHVGFPDKTFPRSQYKLLHSRIDNIHLLVKESIRDLSGFEPNWYRSIAGYPYIPNGPMPYSYSSYYQDYYCNKNLNKILLADETFTWIYVFINRLHWFLKKVDTMDINNDGKLKTVFQLPPKIGKWNGSYVYETNISSWGKGKSVIIGRKGFMPWSWLSQKQYLTGIKKKFEKDVEKYPNTSFGATSRERLVYINEYLSNASEETLAKPAIIDPRYSIYGFKGKFGDEENGGYRLVLLTANDKYFDKSLPRDVPQLIQLYWSYGGNAPEQHVKEQLEQNFPLEKLKAMIDQ